jgi:hypothetical protein
LSVITRHLDAEALVGGDGGGEEGDGAARPLVGQDLREGQTRGIIDRDVDELPTEAAAVALTLAIPRDAVADAIEAAELLDVDVEQLAGMRLRPRRFRMRLTVAGETPTSAAICWPVRRWRRKASTCSTTAAGVGRDRRCGRELRSASPARPSA